MKTRYEELDSIRGIASLIVLIHHCLLVIPSIYASHLHRDNSDILINIISYSPVHILWAGHEMVILFFVLSGFVLSLPQIDGRPFHYKNYLIKRICRIYIPYVSILVLSFLIYKVYTNFSLMDDNFKVTSIWFNWMWSEEVSLKLFVSMLLMSGQGIHNLNTVTWSLIHEMRISIILPFIIIFINRKKLNKTILFSIFSFLIFIFIWIFCVCLYLYLPPSSFSFFINNIGYTFYYSIFFLFGVLLAKYKLCLSKVFEKMTIKFRVFVGLVTLLGITNEWIIPRIGSMKYSKEISTSLFFNFIVDFTIAFSVFLLFILVLSSKYIKVFLGNPFLLYLGRISFSLYLVHPIVLMAFVNMLRGTVKIELLILIVILNSIFFAHFLQKYLEIPTINLGLKIIKIVNRQRKVA
ncbi:peptidoglycan/LPS O-acetylase OafA/YrhL [Exiguobacterium sp. PvP048]|uniref:acyltransferase family protein n=1 Tax=unclassified Exiguobacterium TaxID=2644629 RepID=UPI003396C851